MSEIKIEKITPKEATAICNLLSLQYQSIMSFEKDPFILIKVGGLYSRQALHINRTGEIYHLEEQTEDIITPVNTIPIIDYLRQEKILD